MFITKKDKISGFHFKMLEREETGWGGDVLVVVGW